MLAFIQTNRTLPLSASVLLVPVPALAQGQPVDMGSHIPVAFWGLGVCVLGAVIAYGIMQNRKRSRAEKQMTDNATRANYSAEERSRPSTDIQ